MNIEQLQAEMKKISENPTLTNEEKMARIKIYQSYIESLIQETKYSEAMLDYITEANDFSSITQGTYLVEPTLDGNKLGFKGYILDSDFVRDLESRGITNYTIDDLKQLASEYSVNTKNNLSDIDMAIDLYKKTEKLEDIERKQMEIMEKNLGDLLGKSVVSKNNEIGIIQNDGKSVMQLTSKSKEQLQADYQKAMSKIDELYVNEGILDLQTKNATTQMLNQLFSYYKNGNKKLPMQLVQEMKNNKNYKQGKSL